MSVTVREFSRLLAQCQLLEPEQCRQWLAQYARERGLQPDMPADDLAAWLVQRRTLTAYQARVLMAGQAGPFVYGAYRVCDRIAGGRLAGLFQAVHMPTQHPVSLWFLSGPALADAVVLAGLRELCMRVSQAAAGRPQLARPWQLVDAGMFKFVVLESLSGESLEEALQTKGALAPAEACRHVWHAAHAVAALHAAGLVHGDVRLANLLLVQGGVKLLSFPLAPDPLAPGLHARIAQLAQNNQAVPEVDYLASEVAMGQPPGPAADIYSLGCTLYRLLAGRVVFPAGSAAERLACHAQQMPQPIEQVAPGVPPALAQLVAAMLAKQPYQRPSSAAQLCEALACFVDPQQLQGPMAQALPTDAAFHAAMAAQQANRPVPTVPGAATQASAAASPSPVPAPLPQTPLPAPPMHGPAAGAAEQSPLLGIPPQTAQPAWVPTGPAVSGPTASTSPAAGPTFGGVFAPTVSPSTGGTRVRRAQDRSQLPVVIGSVGAALAAIAAFAYFMSMGGGPSPEQQVADAASARSGVPGGRPQGDVSPRPQGGGSRTDSGPRDQQVSHQPRQEGPVMPARVDTASGVDEPLWELPRHGPPIVLEWLPPGPQMVVVLRPARLLAHPEGDKLLDPRTLGPLATLLAEEVPKLTGLALARLDRLVVGVYDMSPEPVEVSLVAYAADELVLDELLAAWGSPKQSKVQAAEGSTATVWQRDGRAWWLPETDKQRTVVAVPQQALAELVAAGSGPVVLRRQLELLLRTSDREHEFTLLVAPDFLFTGGKALLSGPAAKLKQPLDDFLTFRTEEGKFELPKAAMLSASLDERLFLELRIDNSSSLRPSPALAREYHAKVRSLSRQVNAYLRSLYLSPYSKEVLWDFPDRLTALGRMTTSGIDENQVVLRAYLPAKAAHNLMLNGYLALLETPGAAPSVATAGGGPLPPARPAAAQQLEKRMPLSFPRNTLERALEMVSEEIGVPIIILGTDLQVEGITKNQSFGMDEAEQPARDILRKILAKADPAGRLLYVIKPREEDGQEVLYVTTRAAAEKRRDPLPPEFAAREKQAEKGQR